MSMTESTPPQGPPLADTGDPPDHSTESHGRATILVVEDEPDAREYMKAFLEGEGYRYLHAGSGAQALPRLQKALPDLIIVDFMMPGMTGLELCAKLRSDERTRSIPIIVFSAFPLNPVSKDGLYDHAILKPADFEQLVRAIRSFVHAAN